MTGKLCYTHKTPRAGLELQTGTRKKAYSNRIQSRSIIAVLHRHEHRMKKKGQE